MALESLDGAITGVLYHQPSKFSPTGTPFLVAKLSGGLVIKGEMRKPVLHASYRFWGKWVDSKPPYTGQTFAFEHHELLIDRSTDGLAACLADHVDGIGLAKGLALVEAFGEQTFDVLRETPERAAEVKGITPEIVENIKGFFTDNFQFDPVAYAKLIDLFAGQGFPKKAVPKLLELFGSDAPELVKANPYVMLALPRCGWKRVDAFATTKVGYNTRGQDRQRAGIIEAFEVLAQDGHTYGRRSEVEGLAYGLLGYRPDADAWTALIDQGDITAVTDDTDSFGLPAVVASTKLADAEATIAARLADLAEHARPISFRLDGPKFNEDQARAAELIRGNGMAILSGLPGTGKSWTVAQVAGKLARRGLTVRAAAPTGKAAKRLEELFREHEVVGVPCSTIHKMLGPALSGDDEGVPAADAKTGRGRDSFGFIHNESNPLDIDVLVLDELSMVDVRLMASTLRAVPNGARVIFVGDPNQLPSVGPGSVLRDLIAAGVPMVSLTKIKRSNPGRVVEACHAIHANRVPQPAPDLDPDLGDNWIHIEAHDGGLGEAGSQGGLRSIVEEIAEIYTTARDNGRNDPLWDLQVVSAQKEKFPFSCGDLNRTLCRLLNPRAASDLIMDQGGFEPPFIVGDKVLRTKNGKVTLLKGSANDPDDFDDTSTDGHWTWRGKTYTTTTDYVVNGDIGQIEDIIVTAKQSWVVVRFRNPDRLVRMKYEACHLRQAYAITVHSAQGSGFPVVIVPVSLKFYWDQRTNTGLFSKELVYTAMSRTERILVTVGSAAAIRAAVGRPTLHQRRTTLKARLVDALASVEAVATP